jgi:hypothetical protein
MAEQLSADIDGIWTDMIELMGNHVLPHWEQIDSLGEQGLQLPKWDSPEALQQLVNSLGNRMTEILSQGHKIALEVCTTKQQGPHSPRHHQSRKTARLRTKYVKVRQKLCDIRYEGGQLLNTQHDMILLDLLKEQQSKRGDEISGGEMIDPEEQLRGEGGKEVETAISQKLKNIDVKDASYTVQRHRERQQKVAESNQKLGNKIMTGQYKPAMKHALRVLKDGNKLLTEPADIIDKCYRSMSEHHATRPTGQFLTREREEAEVGREYPWERRGALDRFKLETNAHDGSCKQGLHSMVMDRAEFERCLTSLSSGKQPGPDEVPNEIIKAAPPLLQDSLHMLMMLMWATGCTPDKWKESYTVLLYKNKGTILELDYYRRIGLENTLYKFWTKLVQGIFASYADKHNILSQEQGGFRAFRSTVHQLEIHTMLLEDARLMGQDIFTILVDLKEAFDTIDHAKMHKILSDLGYPTDAIQVVKGLYDNAFTQVVTPYGKTAPIRVQRGTLQGDSLSPFLFILYLEPLLRWLSVGARGYQPGVFKRQDQLITFSNGTYADDITLYAEGHSNLSLQAEKVSRYATWGGLIISQTKTIATAALYKRQPKKPLDKELVERLLGGIQMQGRPIMSHDPREPYKLLGVWFTMDINWKKQYNEVLASLKSMAANMSRSYNSQTQKLRTMQTCLKAKARYSFPLGCYSDKEIAVIDRVMDSIVRQAYHLPKGTPTAMIREDVCRGGLGNTSLMVSYVTTAVKNLTEALEEQGKRGQLTRAMLKAQLRAYTHPSAAKGEWVPQYSLRLRQLIQGTRAQIYQWKNGEEAYPLPDTETSQTILGNIEIWDKDDTLERIKKQMKRLQEIGVFTLTQLVNRKASRLLGSRDIARNAGLTTLKGKYKKALKDIAKVLATEDYKHSQMASTDRGYAIDQSYARWLQLKLKTEQEYMPAPEHTLQEIYAKAPRDLLRQKTVKMVCGGKRERPLSYDPDIRQADPVSLETVVGHALVDSSRTEPEAEAQQKGLDIAKPDETGYALTRRARAQQMLSKKVPAVTVYNMLCAYKDKVSDVPGTTQVVGKHTKWRKKARQNLASQLQWKVEWAPNVLEGWEKDLAINKMGYKASMIRPATKADLQTIPLICEHCDQEEGVERCRHCHRGFHTMPCPLAVEDGAHTGDKDLIRKGLCWECRRHADGTELDDGDRDGYKSQVTPWYIEWEPKWENAATIKELGYDHVVNHTVQIHATDRTRGPINPRPPKDHHLSNRDRQGNQGPRMHSTIGEEARQKCKFQILDTDPHLDIFSTGRYELQEREVYRRITLPNGEKRDSTVNMVTVHDPAGRTVGMLTPDRVALLHHHFTHVLQNRNEVVERLQPKPFAEELAALLRIYKNGIPVPGTKRKVDLTNHWATPVGVYDML